MSIHIATVFLVDTN